MNNITCINLVMQKFKKSYSTILHYKKKGDWCFDLIFFFFFATLINKYASIFSERTSGEIAFCRSADILQSILCAMFILIIFTMDTEP